MTTQTAAVTVTGIDCVCYLAKDFARAKNFYQSVLGLKPTIETEAYCEYDLSDGTTFALSQLPEGRWFPTGGAMFAVPDTAAAVAAIRALGLPIH
ncbi:MAG: VOC family protein, partial [Candidatus Eremiobacteraeota bacterium]|nr:VOC family protein [Candidatus Eremiobacteraeota bacterium]